MKEYIDTSDLVDRRQEILDILEDEQELEAYSLNEIDWMKEELTEINAVENEVTDFIYGETLIHEDSFIEYAQQFAEDVIEGFYEHQKESSWPYNYIDWDAAADALKEDYITVEYQDETYYVRGY